MINNSNSPFSLEIHCDHSFCNLFCTLLKKRNDNILWHYFKMFRSFEICPHIVHKRFLLIRMKINEVKNAMKDIIHV